MRSELLRTGGVLAGAGLAWGLWSRLRTQRELNDLRGQVVLITGGSRGLGLALARAFGKLGCRVAICARDEDTLVKAAAALRAEGVELFALSADVSDREQVERLVAQVTAHYGQIDLLVTNAVSTITVGPVEAQRPEDFESSHSSLYWGVVYPSLAVLPQMLARHAGRIAVISSIGGKIAVPHMLPYSGAKFAAVGFAEGLRAEMNGKGVSVTTIAPGTLQTGAHLHARYTGRAVEEFSWFAKGELAPPSVPVERAAQQIVAAVAGRRGEVIFPASSRLMAGLHGAFPNLATRLTGLVNRYALPQPPDGPPESGKGIDLEQPAQQRDGLLRLLTRLRRPALEQLNQYPDVPID